MRKVSSTGNSLAYLLCQEQKLRVAHGQTTSTRTGTVSLSDFGIGLTGNSLAYLLCQEQKRRVAHGQTTSTRTGTVSSASCADKQDERELV